MIGFDPVIQPEDFRSAFTAAESWGTFSQRIVGGRMQTELELNWGNLKLNSLRLNPREVKGNQLKIMLQDKVLEAKLVRVEKGVTIEFAEPIIFQSGGRLNVLIH